MSLNHSPKIVTDGLVLCLDAANKKSYPGSGTSWLDRSGNNNNGTLINSPTFSSDNVRSIVFNGSNQYTSNIQSSSVQLIDSMSISCWFKPNNFAGGRQGLVGRNGLNEYTITLEPSGGISFYFSSVGQSGNYYNGMANKAFGQTNGVFQHLVFVRDYDSNIIYCYKNSSLVSSSSIAGVNKPTATAGPMTIGFGNGGYFNGSVSQISMYNRALTVEEIQQTFNATRGRFGI